VLLQEAKTKTIYVANAGNNTSSTDTQSGIARYTLTTSPYNLTLKSGSYTGSGAGPQCMVEDPSDQYIYTANYNDSTVTGHYIDQSTGELSSLKKGSSSYTLNGPATWCIVDSRTD
jgi:6-phosphogluconolactonase (cycloisomerase 2 family)